MTMNKAHRCRGIFGMALHGVSSVAILLFPAIWSGCTITNPSGWTFSRPQGLDQVWTTHVPAVTFSNTPLPEVVECLNSILQCESEGVFSLRLAPHPDDGKDRVSCEAADISFGDLMKVVAKLSHRAIAYKNRTVVLAERSEGNGRSTIEITGHCVDSVTKDPLKKFSATIAYFPDFRTQEQYRCIVTNYGNKGLFKWRIQVPAYISSIIVKKEELLSISLKSQDVAVVMSAPGYQANLFQLPIGETNLFYTINVGLAPD